MADLTTIKKQINAILGTAEDTAGVKQYSAVSGDEDFLDGFIARAIEEAKIIVAERVCQSDNSTLKSVFIQANQSITHGALIPTHYGNIFNVKIVPYSGAGASAIRGQKRSAELISAYRNNFDNVYGQTAHNAADEAFETAIPSQLAGFYSDEHNLFEFTGHTATINFADFTNVALTAYPTSLEVPITHIAVGLLAKDGSVSDKFNEHFNIGLGLLGDVVADKQDAVTKE